MKALRLVIVTPRFWPLVDAVARLTANLAVELANRGCPVTVLSARWQPSWPAEIRFRNATVARVSPPPRGAWGSLRYVRALARWLRINAGRYDLVYVSGLGREAYAALRAVGSATPVVLRAERSGPRGDCRWQEHACRAARLKRQCRAAAAVVAPSRAVEQELQAAGYPAGQIRCVPNGVPLVEPRSPSAKDAIRSALAEIHPALQLSEQAPLAVCVGRLARHKGLGTLLAAWERIAARWPLARLWLAGDGPERSALKRQIGAANLTGRVALAGVFDTADDLLAAADLFVLPSLEAGTGVALLEALAAGLPIVTTDLPEHRAWIDHDRHGLLVPAGDAGALAAAIDRLLGESDTAARLASAARQRAAEFSLARMADEHLALFESLCAGS